MTTQLEVQKVTFAGTELECTILNNEPMVGLKRICEGMCVDYSGQLKKLKQHGWAVIKLISTHDSIGRKQEMVMIDLPTLATWVSSLRRVLSESEISTILEELKDFGVETTYISSNKESNFLCNLEQALQPFGLSFQRQYKVGNYFLDAYIEHLNVAIEYDENGHDRYSYEAHEGRQKDIERALDCRFIRVTDKETDSYNIGSVIKQLFNNSPCLR